MYVYVKRPIALVRDSLEGDENEPVVTHRPCFGLLGAFGPQVARAGVSSDSLSGASLRAGVSHPYLSSLLHLPVDCRRVSQADLSAPQNRNKISLPPFDRDLGSRYTRPPNPAWSWGQKIDSTPDGREWMEGEKQGWKTIVTAEEDPT